MDQSNQTHRAGVGGILVFAFYLLAGLAVFLFGSNYIRVFSTNKNLWYEWGLALFLLLVAVIMRRIERLQPYWRVAYALFIAAFVNALMAYLGDWLGRLLPTPSSTAQEYAIDKLSQAIPAVLSMIVLTLLSGEDLRSIFLHKGRLTQGLRFGLISFAVFAAIFAAIAVVQSGGPSTTGLLASGVSVKTLVAALPWILVFVLANSLMEELWFRGISLRKLAPFLGAFASALVTAIVFAALHAAATYISPAERFIFPVIVFALGMVNAIAMQKTDSIWGSMLFHAGYDLLVIIPILAS